MRNAIIPPKSVTYDCVTALFLVKFYQNPPYSMMALMTGLGKTTIHRWFHEIMQFIFANAPFIQRQRNLRQPNVLREFFEEAHAATIRNERTTELYQPWLQAYAERNRLNSSDLNIVVLAWDSTSFEIPTLSEHHSQRRTYSTKGKFNVLVKLIAANMEGRMVCACKCSFHIPIVY